MAAAPSIEEQAIDDFIDFGIDYFLNMFRDIRIKEEIIEIPEDHVFKKQFVDDVVITLTLMRWYYLKLFHFTFVQVDFLDDVKFYWNVWIQNRTSMYEKVVDAFSIAIEAKIYCDEYKEIPLSHEDCKLLVKRCFEDLEGSIDYPESWDDFYKSASVYPASIFSKDYNISHLKAKHIYYWFDDDKFLRILQTCEVRFPVEVRRYDSIFKTAMENKSFVFIRLPTEMNYCVTNSEPNPPHIGPIRIDEISIKDGKMDHKSLGLYNRRRTTFRFFPQDRKYVSLCGTIRDPAPIKEAEEAEYTKEQMTEWKRIFAYAVLKLEGNLNNFYLISPRYKNSLENMLSKRYSGTPGRFFGSSGEFPGYHSNIYPITTAALPVETVNEIPTDELVTKHGVNWIEAIHFKFDYCLSGKRSTRRS